MTALQGVFVLSCSCSALILFWLILVLLLFVSTCIMQAHIDQDENLFETNKNLIDFLLCCFDSNPSLSFSLTIRHELPDLREREREKVQGGQI